MGWASWPVRSNEQFCQHVAMHVGQAVIATAVAEGEVHVVNTKLMQDRRMNIMDVDGVDDGRIAKLVGFAIGHAAAETATGEKQRVAVDMMVSAGVCGVRPISPAQTTIVSSSNPRRFKSMMSAATDCSVTRAFFS